MDIEITGQLHEITTNVKLPDDSPIMENDRGYRMKPTHMSLFWIKDSGMPTFEFMGVEIKGKFMKTNNTVGVRDARKTYWSEIKRLPEWIREIADYVTPDRRMNHG